MRLIINLLVLLLTNCLLNGFAQKIQMHPKHIVLGVGMPNKISITVEGIPCDSLLIKAGGKKLSGDSCTYNILVEKPGKVSLRFYSVTNSDTVLVGRDGLWVLDFPNPIASVAGQFNGESVSRKHISVSQGVVCQLINWDIQLKFPIVNYRAIIIRKGKIIFDKNHEGMKFPPKLKDQLANLKIGDELLFVDLKYRRSEGIILPVSGVTLVVVK